jgi:hypothetical protein
MAFGYAPITETAEDIIKYLKDKGFKLSLEDREFIRTEVYKAIVDAGEAESNGCDCGQVSCPICTP